MTARRSLFAVLALLASIPALAQTANINAAGATFPYPIYSKWFDEYRKLHPGVQINCQPIGSGGGIRQLLDRTVDFGAMAASQQSEGNQDGRVDSVAVR